MAVKKLRFKSEISDFAHLRHLSHRNVVAFKGVCITESFHPCLIMEYCPFGQLCQYLATCGSLTPTRLTDWSRQMASGMAYLHANHIIHRDVKSPNVLISHQSVLKICDFDTSKQLSNGHERRMSLAGTVAWMAPEVIRNELCSEKIDVW